MEKLCHFIVVTSADEGEGSFRFTIGPFADVDLAEEVDDAINSTLECESEIVLQTTDRPLITSLSQLEQVIVEEAISDFLTDMGPEEVAWCFEELLEAL